MRTAARWLVSAAAMMATIHRVQMFAHMNNGLQGGSIKQIDQIHLFVTLVASILLTNRDHPSKLLQVTLGQYSS